MSSNKKNYTLNTVSVDLGCSCRGSKLLSAIFHPTKPKYNSKTRYHHRRVPHHSSSSSTTTTATTATAFSSSSAVEYSSDTESEVRSLRAVQGFGRIGGESLAVEKDSDDPYLDFRRSMLQMILEKEIYAKEDLKELLNCFLQLNSPYYHGTIVRAFTEIWNGVYSRDYSRDY